MSIGWSSSRLRRRRPLRRGGRCGHRTATTTGATTGTTTGRRERRAATGTETAGPGPPPGRGAPPPGTRTTRTTGDRALRARDDDRRGPEAAGSACPTATAADRAAAGSACPTVRGADRPAVELRRATERPALLRSSRRSVLQEPRAPRRPAPAVQVPAEREPAVRGPAVPAERAPGPRGRRAAEQEPGCRCLGRRCGRRPLSSRSRRGRRRGRGGAGGGSTGRGAGRPLVGFDEMTCARRVAGAAAASTGAAAAGWAGCSTGAGAAGVGAGASATGGSGSAAFSRWPSWPPSSRAPPAARRGPGPHAAALRRTRSACASSMRGRVALDADAERRRRGRVLSLLVSPSSFASSWTRILLPKRSVRLLGGRSPGTAHDPTPAVPRARRAPGSTGSHTSSHGSRRRTNRPR